MINFTNVGKASNLAQSLLLYTKTIRFYRKIASRFFPIILQSKRLRLSWNSAFSANFCKFTEFLQTFAVKSLFSLLARKTVQMRTDKHHPNRRKSIVFAKNLLPDFVAISCASATYINLIISFFRKFSHFLRKLPNSNQLLRRVWFFLQSVRDGLYAEIEIPFIIQKDTYQQKSGEDGICRKRR